MAETTCWTIGGPEDSDGYAVCKDCGQGLGDEPDQAGTLETLRGIVHRLCARWEPGEVVDGEGVWSKPGWNEEPDEDPMTPAEAAFFADPDSLLAGDQNEESSDG